MNHDLGRSMRVIGTLAIVVALLLGLVDEGAVSVYVLAPIRIVLGFGGLAMLLIGLGWRGGGGE